MNELSDLAVLRAHIDWLEERLDDGWRQDVLDRKRAEIAALKRIATLVDAVQRLQA